MDLHVFFLPFLAPGHMIPMVDLARLFADRGARATIVTTAGNTSRIRPTIDRANNNSDARTAHPIQLLTISFPSSDAGVPDNITGLPTPDLTPEFTAAISHLDRPLIRLIESHHPDCIVSDVFYPWTVDLGIPRIAFHGTCFFSTVVPGVIGHHKPHQSVDGDDDPFVLPGLPHRIEMTRTQLPSFVTGPDDLIIHRIRESQSKSHGMVMNTFYEMEPEYADMFNTISPIKAWPVGPVSLCHSENLDRAVRGDEAAVESDVILSWLDSRNTGSVLYVCFGSLGKFTTPQLREIASGLEESGVPFLWVVSKDGVDFPEGFEERAAAEEGRGLIIRGWAPQILILNHPAVGGFVTHCGWNSCLEGASAGVPMITWPMFAEQFFNEKLIVDVIGIGIAIGVKVCSGLKEERTVVKGEEVTKAVKRLMGGGEEADGRRRRAREVAEKATRAVDEGGSSYKDMDRLIEDLIGLKAASVGSRSCANQI